MEGAAKTKATEAPSNVINCLSTEARWWTDSSINWVHTLASSSWLSTLDHIILSVSQPLVMMALGSKKLDDTTPEILEQMIH